MSDPTGLAARPGAPPPGAAEPELLVARFRGHARRLAWSAAVLIAVAAATGYFVGNLPEPLQDWMLFAAAGAVVVLAVLWPWLRWLSRRYVVTTRRVIVRSGVGARHSAELSHARGYAVSMRRGALQRLWGTGTLSLIDASGEELRLVDVPDVRLVHETLADQLEEKQILAHRDSQALPIAP